MCALCLQLPNLPEVRNVTSLSICSLASTCGDVNICKLCNLHVCKVELGTYLPEATIRGPAGSHLYMGQPRNSGWAHALPQRVGLSETLAFSNPECPACRPICPYHAGHTFACNCKIPLTVLITTAIASDWRIPQYFSQQLYCRRTSKVNRR